MSSISQICHSTVLELDGGIACCVYILNDADHDASPGDAHTQTLSGLFASHISEREREADVQSFAELAVAALGASGQRLFDDRDGFRSGEFFLAARLWGFARLLPSKNALVILLCHPSESTTLGWAAINSAATRLESKL